MLSTTPRPHHPPQTTSTITQTPRLEAIDMLRGMATLGILLINIVAFALPYSTDDPTNFGSRFPADLWSWIVNKIAFEGSMRTIFSMLFGASMVLFTSAIENSSRKELSADLYYRRTLWLLMFGIFHAYAMLWPGEVLYIYALAGLMLYPFRSIAPWKAIALGILILTTMLPRYAYQLHEDLELRDQATASEMLGDTPDTEDARHRWESRNLELHPDRLTIEEQIERIQSNYFVILKTMVPNVVYAQSELTYTNYIWDALSMMLIGMGLLKLGVLSGKRSTRFYITLGTCAYVCGLTVKSWEVFVLITNNFDPVSQSLSHLTYDIGRLSMAVGHISIAMLIFKSRYLPGLSEKLAAVGRMALTNYVSQTLICSLLFYGIGLGLYGQVARHELYYFVLGIWCMQIIISTIWLRRFQYGPLEWLWRSLTYLHWQQLKRPPPDL